MKDFKGYNTNGLVKAASWSLRNANHEFAVKSIESYLGQERAYDRHKRLCLQKVLRETGISLSEGEAKIVMKLFAVNDYTSDNILLTKAAYNSLSKLGKEKIVSEYKKYFLQYKSFQRANNSPEPIIAILDDITNLSNYVSNNELKGFGMATTLDKVRAGKTKYAKYALEELQNDISYFEENCKKVLNSTDAEEFSEVCYLMGGVISELETYKELLDIDWVGNSQSLETKLIGEVLTSLKQIVKDYKQSLIEEGHRKENEDYEAQLQREKTIENLMEKFERQWSTYLKHYQDVLVYRPNDYVVKNNPYAKRLMTALEATDSALQKLTGESALQIKLLEIEDKYRPIVGHGKVKISRTAVQSGEDE